MDVKAEVEKVVKQIMSDKELQAQFKANPEKALEGVLGVDIPDGMVDQVIAMVKAKMAEEKITDAAQTLGTLKNLLGK